MLTECASIEFAPAYRIGKKETSTREQTQAPFLLSKARKAPLTKRLQIPPTEQCVPGDNIWTSEL